MWSFGCECAKSEKGASLVEVVYMAGSIYGYVILYYNIINK